MRNKCESKAVVTRPLRKLGSPETRNQKGHPVVLTGCPSVLGLTVKPSREDARLLYLLPIDLVERDQAALVEEVSSFKGRVRIAGCSVSARRETLAKAMPRISKAAAASQRYRRVS